MYQLSENEGASVTAQSSGVDQFTPENPIKKIDEISRSSIDRRIRERKLRNAVLRRAIKEGNEEKILDVPTSVRYQLQDFDNSGESYDPETNEVKFSEKRAGPSDYEKWRREKTDKGRNSRMEQDRKDKERRARVATSSYERWIDQSNALDDQVDTFLSEFIEEHRDADKPAKKVRESTLREGAGSFIKYELKGAEFIWSDENGVELWADSVVMSNYENAVDSRHRTLIGTAKGWPQGLDDEDKVIFYEGDTDWGKDVTFSQAFGWTRPSECPDLEIKLMNDEEGDNNIYEVEFEPSEQICIMWQDLHNPDEEYEEDIYDEAYEEEYEDHFKDED